MRAAIVALALMCAACAGDPPPQGMSAQEVQDLINAQPAAQPVLQVCLPLTTVTPAQQKTLRKEYDALKSDALLRTLVFPDWVQMRDEDRACIKAQQK